jgi:hypothetical protein
LLGRVFSVAAPIIAFQMLSNGIAQNSNHDLNQFWFWLNWVSLAASYTWMAASIWILGDAVIAYRAIVVVSIFSLSTWALQLGDEILRPGEQPWIWWGVGIAGVAAIGGFSAPVTGVILLLLPAIWFAIQVSDVGAPVDPWLAFQDATFTFLFSSVLVAFVAVMKYEAAKVDTANHAAGLAAIELAKADAIVREHDRVDALVHDSVLTTLLLAANASSTDEEKEAELLAKAAIAKLQSANTAVAYLPPLSLQCTGSLPRYQLMSKTQAILRYRVRSPLQLPSQLCRRWLTHFTTRVGLLSVKSYFAAQKAASKL